MKTLFSLDFNTEDKLVLTTKEGNPYVEGMKQLKELAGEDWLNRFTKNTEQIKTNQVQDKTRATWFAAFYPTEFSQMTSESKIATKPPNEPAVSADSHSTSFLMQDKSKILADINKILEPQTDISLASKARPA